MTLFARTSRKVEVTPAGEAFVKQARLCLQAAERAKVAAAAAHGEIRGSLTIGVIPTVTAVDVAAVLGAFRRSYPEVSVHVRTGGSDDFLRRIAAGTLDVGFLGLAEAVTPQGVRTRELSRSTGGGAAGRITDWQAGAGSVLRTWPMSLSWTFRQGRRDASSPTWPLTGRGSAAR